MAQILHTTAHGAHHYRLRVDRLLSRLHVLLGRRLGRTIRLLARRAVRHLRPCRLGRHKLLLTRRLNDVALLGVLWLRGTQGLRREVPGLLLGNVRAVV